MSAFKEFWSVLAMPCNEATHQISGEMDHPLTPAKRFGLRLHLLYCDTCRHYRRHLRFLRELAREHGDTLTNAIPQNLSDAAKARIKEKLRES